MANTYETQLEVSFRAPQLPEPPDNYRSLEFYQFNNVLRLYFNQLDSELRHIASLVRPSIINATDSFTLTTQRKQIIVCSNTSSITVTLASDPLSPSEVFVKQAGTGQVTIAGNGKDIDGSSTLVLNSQYSKSYIVYTDTASEWSVL